MYVGITRAMEKLYITLTRYRMKYGRTDNAIPSRFLQEIPGKLLDSPSGSLDQSREPVPFDMDEDETVSTFQKKKERDPFADFEQEVASGFDEEPVFGQSKLKEKKSRMIDPAVRHIIDKIFADDVVQEDPNAFEIGDRVTHELFGDGIVDLVTGSGLNTKLKINFRKSGMKLLLLSMAMSKLRKLS